MWAPHLNLALCSSADTHPFTGNDTITIGWIAVHALVWEHAHSLATWHEVCVFIYCPLNCLMIARFYEHDLKNIVLGNNIIPSWPSHERWACFPREHWNIVKLLPRRMYFLECCRLHFLENSQAYFAPFLARAHLTFFFFGKTRRETKSIMHDAIKRIKSASARPELGTFFMGRRWR